MNEHIEHNYRIYLLVIFLAHLISSLLFAQDYLTNEINFSSFPLGLGKSNQIVLNFFLTTGI